MAEESPSILIVGTGAMACLFAARLCSFGLPVTMMGTWPEGVAALRQHGVRLVNHDGFEIAYPVQVIEKPGELVKFQYALVLVKAWQTARAARQLALCLAPDGLALTLQNGMGNRETLAQILGNSRTTLGSVTTGAYLLEPGKVQAGGEGRIFLDRNAPITSLAGFFKAAGFTVDTVPNITSLLWGKLVINSSINPLTAILRVSNGALLENPDAHSLLRAAAEESARVAAARGISLPYSDPAAAAENVAHRTAQNRSSMLQDVLRGAPTEIDAISGAIVREAEKCSVPAPINYTLWLLVKSLVNL
jgi:2-dehydropantoate 2-reductase